MLVVDRLVSGVGNLGLSRRPLTSSSIDQAAFVNRVVESEAISSAIDLRLNVFVSGAPGSGKTSLLRHVQRSMQERDHDIVYVNVEPSPSIDGTIAQIARGIGGDEHGSPKLLGAEDETALAAIEVALDSRTAIDSAADSKGPTGRSSLIVMVDGITQEATTVLFGRYRDRLWESPGVTWIVASRHATPPAPADAFFDRTVVLAPFTAEAGGALLERRAPEIPEDLRDQLVAAIGNAQPVFWMLAAQRLALADESPDSLIAALAAQRAISNELPDRQRDLYRAVEDLGPVHAGNEELLERVGASRPWTVTALKELEEAGLVQSERDGRRVLYHSISKAIAVGRILYPALATGLAAAVLTTPRRQEGEG